MKYILLSLLLLLSGCRSTPIVNSQSPEVSTAAAAVKDSVSAARFDLTEQYADALNMLVTPPEKRIEIKPVYKDGKKIVVIPDRYQREDVVAVGTQEWNNLLKIKEVANQLANDATNLNNEINNAREEIRQQQLAKEQLVADNAELTSEIEKAKAALFKRTAYLVGLVGLVGAYIFLKIRGLVPF